MPRKMGAGMGLLPDAPTRLLRDAGATQTDAGEVVTAMHTDESQLRLLPVGGGSDAGYHHSGHGEAILLAHAGVFSD